jgi:hypothetical protein
MCHFRWIVDDLLKILNLNFLINNLHITIYIYKQLISCRYVVKVQLFQGHLELRLTYCCSELLSDSHRWSCEDSLIMSFYRYLKQFFFGINSITPTPLNVPQNLNGSYTTTCHDQCFSQFTMVHSIKSIYQRKHFLKTQFSFTFITFKTILNVYLKFIYFVIQKLCCLNLLSFCLFNPNIEYW